MAPKQSASQTDPKGRGHGGTGETYDPKKYDGRNFHNGHPRGGCKGCGGS